MRSRLSRCVCWARGSELSYFVLSCQIALTDHSFFCNPVFSSAIQVYHTSLACYWEASLAIWKV